jgi:hypothetical protein
VLARQGKPDEALAKYREARGYAPKWSVLRGVR